MYAVIVCYSNELMKGNLYDTKHKARCALYYKMHDRDFSYRLYGKPVFGKVYYCKDTEDYDKLFDNAHYNAFIKGKEV